MSEASNALCIMSIRFVIRYLILFAPIVLAIAATLPPRQNTTLTLPDSAEVNTTVVSTTQAVVGASFNETNGHTNLTGDIGDFLAYPKAGNIVCRSQSVRTELDSCNNALRKIPEDPSFRLFRARSSPDFTANPTRYDREYPGSTGKPC